MKIRNVSIITVFVLAWTLALALLWAAAGPGPVAAAAPADPPATLYVCDSGCAYDSIQAAVDAAAPLDTIKVAGGHYSGVQRRADLTQTVYISKSVIIWGSYTPPDWTTQDPIANPTIVDAEGQGRVFYIDGTVGIINVVLSYLHITGGDATGLSGGEVNQYDGAGGGLYVDHADFYMQSCDVYGNLASSAGWGGGGGIYLLYGSNFLAGNNIHHNTASTGTFAGISGEGGGLATSMGPLNLVANTIHHNVASTIGIGIGGGIYMEGTGPLMDGNIVRGNTASVIDRGDGGGIYIGPEADAILTNDVVVGNVSGLDASSSGAGILVEMAEPRLRHTTIHDNTGGDGSGVAIFGVPACTTRMTNTIVSSQTVGVKVGANQTAILDGVLFFANGDDTTGAGTITVNPPVVNTDPRFADDGYHLRPDSSAVDAGLAYTLTYDVEGQTRPFGAGHDLGADEWVYVSETTGPSMDVTLVFTTPCGFTTTLEVPAGAVLQPTTLLYTPIPSPTQPLPAGIRDAYRTFFLDAIQGGNLLPGLVLQKPVSLTVYYSEDDVEGLDESSLRLRYWTGSAWADGTTTCTPPSSYSHDLVNNVLSLPICHISQWNMGAVPTSGQELYIYLPLVMRY